MHKSHDPNWKAVAVILALTALGLWSLRDGRTEYALTGAETVRAGCDR